MLADPVEIGWVKCLGFQLWERDWSGGVRQSARRGAGVGSQSVGAEVHAESRHSWQERTGVRVGGREHCEQS